MKLQSLLTESSNFFDPAHTDKLRDEVTDELNHMLKSLATHGFKISEYTEDEDSDTFGAVVSNKVLDVLVEIQILPGKTVGSEAYSLYIQLSINNDYSVHEGNTLPTEILNFTWKNLENENVLSDNIKRAGTTIEKMSSSLLDWYFDVNGEYGKVKMFVEKRGAENLVRALAGDFSLSQNSGEVY